MKRKSPYRHDVSSYVRADGTRVVDYQRGKGRKPREKRKPQRIVDGNIDYRVTLIFTKGSETHIVNSNNLPGAAYGGLQSLKVAKIPHAMRIKEAKN